MTATVDLHAPTRILLVSRDRDFAAIYGVMLRHVGYEVLVAGDGDGAVRLAERERPNLVVVDFPTVTADGRTVTEQLHAGLLTRELPVLSITARVTGPEVANAWRCGSARVLAMPVSPRAVADEIARVLAPG